MRETLRCRLSRLAQGFRTGRIYAGESGICANHVLIVQPEGATETALRFHRHWIPSSSQFPPNDPNWESPHAEATFEQDLPYRRTRKLLNPFVGSLRLEKLNEGLRICIMFTCPPVELRATCA
jgi:hypothetical protein